MARLTDGQRIVDIMMRTWVSENIGFTADWSKEFFNVDSLPYDEDEDAYLVQDVESCIEHARDWKYGLGDFKDSEISQYELDNRMIWIDGDVE